MREALLALYSPAQLEGVRLAEVPALFADRPDRPRGEMLRRLLLDTIERLRPVGRVAPSASEYRAHECVSLRYITGLSVEEIADELSLSPRQVYRDLRWGEARLADLLSALAGGQPAGADDPLSQEMRAVGRRSEPINLAQALRAAVAAVAPLAERYGASLRCRCPAEDPVVTGTPGMLREALVQWLSAVVQSLGGGAITIELAAEDEWAAITIPLARPRHLARGDLLAAAMRVLEAQGLECALEPALRLTLPLARPRRVLIVEDNPSATALYERYLAGTEWEPVIASHPSVAVALALSKRAQAVILDVMMPDADGWSVLQALKVDERSRDIPVIICSVVNDPELGHALGACQYITKPVSRPALLQALRQALAGRSSDAAAPDTPAAGRASPPR